MGVIKRIKKRERERITRSLHALCPGKNERIEEEGVNAEGEKSAEQILTNLITVVAAMCPYRSSIRFLALQPSCLDNTTCSKSS